MNTETQPASLHFEYALSPEEFLEGQELYCSRLGTWWVRFNYKGMVLLGLLLIAEGITAAFLKLGFLAVVLLPALGLYYILNKLVFWPMKMRREYRKYPDINGTRTLTADENGVVSQTSHGRGEILWARFSVFGETERIFVLLAPPRAFITVPKRAIPTESLSEFRNLLSRKLAAR